MTVQWNGQGDEKGRAKGGDALRLRAEGRVREMGSVDLAGLFPEEVAGLVHELRVHQIELELQNDELREIQQRLEEARQRYFDLYDLAPVGYVTLSERNLIREANLRAAELLGCPRSALVGQPLSRFIFFEDQDSYYRHRNLLFEKGESKPCEVRVGRPEGAWSWVRMDADLGKDQPGGETVCRATLTDITERRRAEEERERLNAQLAQARKMESVGRLAGGVAHEFNNMLSIIVGYAETALDSLDPGESVHADISEIFKAGLRAAEITRQLLAFACKQPVVPKVMDLNRAVVDALKMIRRIIEADIEINYIANPSIWRTRIDPSQIDQVVINLALNARDAISGIGKIFIRTGDVTADDAFCREHPEAVPGEYVLLSVRDTGAGMSPEVLEHIFEPFFTTKEVGKGTGLGLATVHGIVAQNHGFINVTSEPGRGTEFRIYLPRYIEAPEESAAKNEAGRPPSNETVLVVEDEAAVLKLARTILTRQGYTVLAAESPAAAMALVRDHGQDIDLVVTDVVMPEMNGQELADRLLALKPGMKRLFMSGYTADAIGQRGVIPPGVGFIQKPFSRKDLLVKVREALDGRG